MTSADSRGEKILAALAANKNCELTPDGANYIVQRFDPYHDKPIRPVGYPDSFNGHTVSRCVKKTMSLTYKSGGAPDQTTPWDLHIFQTPIMKPAQFNQSVTRSANTFTFNPLATATRPYGGLMAVASLVSGTPVNLPVGLASFDQLGQIALSDSDLDDTMRVTAMGFEVIDGTAELYRQGILTTYRQNQPQRDAAYFKGVSIEGAAAATRQTMEGSFQMVRCPPVSSANALLMPDSKQWKVAEGAYVDIDYNDQDIPMLSPSNIVPYLVYDDNPTQVGFDTSPIIYQQPGFGVSGVSEPTPGTAGVGTTYHNSSQGQRILPINQSGVILTGLNPLATITVNAIYYLECAPTSDDQELLSLASQSPALDDYALMIVSKLRRDSPVAVKRRENYTGQWFFEGVRDIIKKVSPWLANASYVGNQVSSWIDRAGTNDGMINPQSFVKGSVATKIASEKHPKKRIPNAPGPTPRRVAFRPNIANKRTLKGKKLKFNDNVDDQKRQRRARRAKARRGAL